MVGVMLQKTDRGLIESDWLAGAIDLCPGDLPSQVRIVHRRQRAREIGVRLTERRTMSRVS